MRSAASIPPRRFRIIISIRMTRKLLRSLIAACMATLPVGPEALAELREAVVARTALEHPGSRGHHGEAGWREHQGVFASIIQMSVGGLSRMGRQRSPMSGSRKSGPSISSPALARLFPEARFIVIHRDPRAVVASLLAMGRKDPTQKAHLGQLYAALAQAGRAGARLRGRIRPMGRAPGRRALRRPLVRLRRRSSPGCAIFSASGWKLAC